MNKQDKKRFLAFLFAILMSLSLIGTSGANAVELVLDGKSGYMVTLEADRSSNRYSWKTGQADLDQVANLEKKFPAEWILDNYSVAEAFWDYCLPLIGSDLPEFCFMC